MEADLSEHQHAASRPRTQLAPRGPRARAKREQCARRHSILVGHAYRTRGRVRAARRRRRQDGGYFPSVAVFDLFLI